MLSLPVFATRRAGALPSWAALFPLLGFLLSLPLAASAAGSPTLVISQVYGGGGNSGATYTNDFIELHNVSGASISLTGYSVQYASSTGTSWSVTPLSGTIAPGGYYLIQEAAGAGGTTALPTPNATGSINLAASPGKVALVSSTTALTTACPTGGSIIDFVGFGGTAGTANFCYEGTGPTPAPSNTTSVSRKASGCTDTDQNGADFTAGAPNPRNDATSAAFCVTAVTGFTPTNGQAGTVVTLSGGLLSGITSVTFAGIAATNVSASASTVTATVAPGTPLGAAPVVLSDGTTSYTAPGSFTVTTASISTPTLSTSAVCAGGTVGVSFSGTGTFAAGNVFSVELSTATGTFPTTPTVVGSVTSTSTASQTVTATIPTATAGGTGYKVRVTASNPAITSNASAAFPVNTVRIAPTATQNSYTTTSGTTLMVSEVGTPTSRQWAYATTSGGPYTDLSGQTGTSYTPFFTTAGTYYVVARSTFACGPQLSNEVQVNVTVAQLPTISSFTPAAGPAGTSVTITGTGFISGATVSFNGTASPQVTLVSATTLRAVAPTGVTTGTLSVTTAGGTATSTSSFTATTRTLDLLDDFNRTDNTTVGNGWTETETVAAGASVSSNQLKLGSSTSGREFISRSLAARYDPVLTNNSRVLTWAWNMQQTRPNPSTFDASAYAVAYVLAASSDNLLTGTGYAVVVGNSGTPDPVRLVRYANGLASTLTTIVTGDQLDAANKFQTIRVTYLPDEDTWTLEAATTTTAFQDPTTATYATLGSAVDGTYTATSLPYTGCLWNHATSATDYALFDNVYVTAPCVLETEPTTGPGSPTAGNLTSSSADLSWTVGTGTSRLVLVRPASAAADAPADATAYAATSQYGRGALVGTSSYAVYSGTGTSVTVTGLAPNTAYAYQVYEASGAGCSLNYLQASPATGTFTTPPCLAAATPTGAASNGQATAATYSLAVSWTSGNGAQRLVVVQAGQAPTAAPADASAYRASARFGAGSALGGGYVVYSGMGSAVTVTGLSPTTTYYTAVYEFNGSDCSAAYLTSTPATAQATTLTPPPATASSYHFYRGNLHAHSSYSDGNKDASTSGASTPSDDYALAQLAQQFDFLGISEHNHNQAGMSLPSYAKGLQQADASTLDGTFIALYGMEWGTISGGGHVVVYGYPQLIGWEPGNYDVFVAKGDYSGPNGLFATVAQQPGAVAYLAHPQATDYNGLFSNALNPVTADVLVGAAMRSGPAFSTNTTYTNPSTGTYEARFKDALRLGYHVAPTLDHDSHYSVFGRSTPGRLVLLAPTLTRPALLDALQQRRFYASDDLNTEVTLTASNQVMGSVTTQAGAPTLSISVTDTDANDAVASIVLYSGIPGSGTAATQLTSNSGAATLSYTDPIADQATYYYYAVITQADGDKMWTAPIWYTRNDALAAGPLPVQLVRFQAVLHNEVEAVLRWATASEAQSAYFAVERSLDGRTFAEIGRRTGAGTSLQAHTYELPDPQALVGLTYYRLRQVDTDGTSAYSQVVTLTPAAREATEVHVYPNPSAGRAVTRLALRGLDQQLVQVRVTDVLGRVVSQQQVIPLGYQADAPLRLPAELASGVYSVSLTAAGQTWTTKLVLEP
ncbi:MAG: CehA/McbA family metallohydrolase [Janthinobacterium lividum]